jgi:hypothetical protein
VDVGERVRTQVGSALPVGGTQGAPGTGREVDRESLPLGIRALILGWTGGRDPRDDEERLAAIRKGPRFVAPPAPDPPGDAGKQLTPGIRTVGEGGRL